MRFFFQGKSILLLNLLMYKQNKPIKKKLKLKFKKKKNKRLYQANIMNIILIASLHVFEILRAPSSTIVVR